MSKTLSQLRVGFLIATDPAHAVALYGDPALESAQELVAATILRPPVDPAEAALATKSREQTR